MSHSEPGFRCRDFLFQATMARRGVSGIGQGGDDHWNRFASGCRRYRPLLGVGPLASRPPFGQIRRSGKAIGYPMILFDRPNFR